MKLPLKIYFYLARQYGWNFLFLLSILLGVVYLFDTVELLRRGANYDLNLGLTAKMSLFKLPEVGQLILPFAILFSGIYTFWSLTRSNELIVIRSAGFSAWQFLTPVLLTSLLIGIVATTVINPMSAVFLKKYEHMEVKYLNKKNAMIDVSQNGIWLRSQQGEKYTLLRAAELDPKNWRLNNIIVFFYDQNDTLLKRMDADTALLRSGYWEIQNVYIHDSSPEPVFEKTVILKTDLTATEIEDSFASPETLSFWELPSFIKTMEETGFPATRLKVHYQSLLAQPFFFTAMILLAAAVSLRPSRFGSTTSLVTLGIMIGFFIFFLGNILHAFGISQNIPVLLAAWTPTCVSLLLGVSTILYLEDG